MGSSHRRIGRRGERGAARFLRHRGLRVLASNVRAGGGEIDLVAIEGETLVFVEVKSRTAASWREGFEKIDGRKRRALRKACRAYLRSTTGDVEHFRIDGVVVELEPGLFRLRVRGVEWERGLFRLDPHDV